jgi:hypothetical protein
VKSLEFEVSTTARRRTLCYGTVYSGSWLLMFRRNILLPSPCRGRVQYLHRSPASRRRVIVRLEGVSQLKNPVTSSGIESVSFRFVA